jgi:HAD superfamily hydrolase (TIGR01549 family)
MTPNHTDTPIRLVTFDLYDTLIELHPRRWERLAAACRAVGIEPDLDALKAADLLAEDFYTEENGRIPIRDRTPEERETFRLRNIAIWLEAAGLPYDDESTRAVRRAYIAEMEAAATRANYHVYDDVIPAMRRLRDAGIKRALISNADADVTALCTRLEFAHEMNLIVTSAVVGWEKPDVRTFRAALDPLGVEPHEAIHIGDQPKSDVVGARAAGMRAALIDRYIRHDPAAHDVPVVHGLMELVDLVLAHNEAGRRQGGEPARREGGKKEERVIEEVRR